ncbi:hypothetical protein [Sorangium sp. So ce124]|uniref:hypothetical protein n=1 Tax=Sorangium sp. So ce124 TaxID=3133280 RepID=UPI003F5D9F16
MQIRAQAGQGTVSFNSQLTHSVVSEFRNSWANEIDNFFVNVLKLEPGIQQKLPARGDSIEAIEACLASARDALDGDLYAHDPPPSFRLDAFLRVRALVLLRRLRKMEPYNPAKRQNDSFDHELLKYLAYPAALCSDDRLLIASVRATKSWQVRWIIRPRQLRQRQLVESLASLDWPYDEPAQQANEADKDPGTGSPC